MTDNRDILYQTGKQKKTKTQQEHQNIDALIVEHFRHFEDETKAETVWWWSIFF